MKEPWSSVGACGEKKSFTLYILLAYFKPAKNVPSCSLHHYSTQLFISQTVVYHRCSPCNSVVGNVRLFMLVTILNTV